MRMTADLMAETAVSVIQDLKDKADAIKDLQEYVAEKTRLEDLSKVHSQTIRQDGYFVDAQSQHMEEFGYVYQISKSDLQAHTKEPLAKGLHLISESLSRFKVSTTTTRYFNDIYNNIYSIFISRRLTT